MEASCSGRLARRSALDSFDPSVWKEYRGCVLKQPSLVDEVEISLDVEKLKGLLIRTCSWRYALRDHRFFCDACRIEKTRVKNGRIIEGEDNIFGLNYFKGNHRGVCINVAIHANKRRDVCYSCCDNWTGWRFCAPPSKMNQNCILKHAEPLVTQHIGPWELRTFHLKCALEKGIVTKQEVDQCKNYMDFQARKVRVTSEYFLLDSMDSAIKKQRKIY